MRGRRLVPVGLCLGLVVLLAPASALGCSCASLSPREALREADAAVVGRLVKVVPRGAFRASYRYEVRWSFRGGRRVGVGRVISVRSSSESSACALPRRTGRSYGLLLTWREGSWTGGLCGVVSPRRLHAAAASTRIFKRPRISGSGGGCGG